MPKFYIIIAQKIFSPEFLSRTPMDLRMAVLLQYVQLVMDKTNAADLLSGIFAILIHSAQFFIGFTRTKNTKSIAVPRLSSKTGKE